MAFQLLIHDIEFDLQKREPYIYRSYFWLAGAYEASGQLLKAAIDYKVVCLLTNKGCDKADQLLNHR